MSPANCPNLDVSIFFDPSRQVFDLYASYSVLTRANILQILHSIVYFQGTTWLTTH